MDAIEAIEAVVPYVGKKLYGAGSYITKKTVAGTSKAFIGTTKAVTNVGWGTSKALIKSAGSKTTGAIGSAVEWPAQRLVANTGKLWDSSVGKVGTAGLYAKAGILFGGATALVEQIADREISDEAMQNSQQGSAYSGYNGFGSRTGVRTMGQSTNGLVNGLHNSRKG